MNIAITLQHLFPNSTPRVDWSVVDDGDGQFIAEWNLPDAQPIPEQLNAAWPAANSAHEWGQVRSRRSVLLDSSDWTQLPDVPMSDEKRGEWVTYRQDLRDITTQPEGSVSWPVEPV